MNSEAQKEAIKKEARAILDKFAKALDKAPSAKNVLRVGSSGREEFDGVSCDEDFRERMFANAPRKDENCIISEKGAWVA